MSQASKVEPVEAATVILTREGRAPADPWQCFMVRRHIKSDFAADVFVFPGGKVDEADRDPELDIVSVGHPGPAGDSPQAEAAWRSLRIAAIRELFEEAGVLIARRDERFVRLEGIDAARFAEHRRAIQSGSMTMLALAQQEGLSYPLDRLHPVSRWITPDSLPRRFDTYFFVTQLPAGQEPVHDEHETTAGIWISPREALHRYEAGEFPLVYATEHHLRRLVEYGSVEGLIASATPESLVPVQPMIVRVGGEERFLLPGDEGYVA